MKLTKQQTKMVEDNHNLIYWYANMKNLNLEEWYDILAIELCYTVLKFNPSRSGLSTYFKLRADGAVYKEIKKASSIKRSGITIEYKEEVLPKNAFYIIDDEIILNELLDSKDKEIVTLKSHGYTQAEIADKLGVSQSYISKLLKQLREAYYCGGTR